MRLKILSSVLLTVAAVSAQNPIVQTCFTTDPAPMVDGDTFYIYTGHDENGADFFWMQEWRVYSSKDMVNWTDHGSPLAIEDFSWGDDRAWAPQCVARDGKYYFYVPLHSSLSGGMAIGVAVGDSPTGPFKDALGKPLFDDGSWDNIDPTVFIDDDGQAWIFWGNPVIRYAKLNRDMISIDGDVKTVVQTAEGFGAPGLKERKKDAKIGPDGDYKDCYTEGPWIMKRGKKYYLLYAAGGIPEHIAYSMADSPEGPWKYMGPVMPLQDTGSFTNHCGVADFKGKSYFAYHTGKLPGGGGFGRSVALEEFRYNPDGTFPTINMTEEGVSPVATLDPFKRVEAETMAYSKGVIAEQNAKTGVYLSGIHNGDWIKLRNVDFGKGGAAEFKASAASALRGGVIEVRLDSVEGPVVATLPVKGTGGWEEWQTFSTRLSQKVSGVHDLYLLFSGRKGPRLFNLDWWEFKQ